MSLIQTIQKSDSAGSALWKLPGLLPRPPALSASQTLLWISKLIMEVNSVSSIFSVSSFLSKQLLENFKALMRIILMLVKLFRSFESLISFDHLPGESNKFGLVKEG